jgi:hypothetical protein
VGSAEVSAFLRTSLLETWGRGIGRIAPLTPLPEFRRDNGLGKEFPFMA